MKKFLHAGQFRDKLLQLRGAYDSRYRDLLARTRLQASSNPTQIPPPWVDENLEYHARIYIINGFFEALNWPLVSDDHLPPLIPEEPILSLENGKVKFIDYFGFNPTTQRPLLIIEAKRPNLNLPFISPPQETEPAHYLSTKIAESLQGEATGKQWNDILSQIKEYIESTNANFGYPPKRAVITNGDWLVLFANPKRTFIDRVIDPKEIIVFINTDDILRRADQIWEYLEYAYVAGDTGAREIEVGELPFVIDSKKIKKITLGIRLVYFEEPTQYKARPEVNVLPIVLIASDTNKWLIVSRHHDGFEMPHDYGQLRDHFRNVAHFGSTLLADTLTTLGIHIDLSPVIVHYEQEEDDFNEIKGVQEVSVDRDRRIYKYIIITGKEFHFIREQPTLVECKYHKWEGAQEDAVAIEAPIIITSVSHPRSFFVNGQDYHCAHSTVQAAKMSQLTVANRPSVGRRSGNNGAAFCEIIQFEEYLCCRTCIFELICTKVALFNLPCHVDAILN